jgi:hypothetical protein
MTEAELVQTPGYQFNLSQGLRAAQNSAAARGLGVSGAALRGAANYATGLADSTYQNQFANQQTLWQDQVNSLLGGFNTQQTSWQDQLQKALQGYGMSQQSWADTAQNAMQDFANRQQAFSDAYNNTLANYQGQQGRFNAFMNEGSAAQQQISDAFNRAYNTTALGSNAASQLGTNAINAGNSMAQTYGNTGAAQAAGSVGTANALGGALSNAANSYQQYTLLNHLIQNQNGGGGATVPYLISPNMGTGAASLDNAGLGIATSANNNLLGGIFAGGIY